MRSMEYVSERKEKKINAKRAKYRINAMGDGGESHMVVSYARSIRFEVCSTKSIMLEIIKLYLLLFILFSYLLSNQLTRKIV